ncbi:hypothetical protein OM416_19140 [Paenibacillus sp. LS1]|uniref:hypothetical protein n=1 Tax=Paenibacillus sp. LS1 TaxID=2992120 RepID=UPI0022305937|nr:hypothetical protein [Paenibacillus sp. LS1]MCW3793711.1 hypothetical protein [Paenibacillus sp. LS1]
METIIQFILSNQFYLLLFVGSIFALMFVRAFLKKIVGTIFSVITIFKLLVYLGLI